jgi:hypothetical protein
MRTRIEIRRVDVWALFKVGFLLYAAIGLLIGLFYWFVLVVAGGIGSAFLAEEDLPNLGILGGVLGIVLVPVMAFFYGAICGLMAVIVGALFNLITQWSGGIVIEGEIVDPTHASPAFEPPPPNGETPLPPAAD